MSTRKPKANPTATTPEDAAELAHAQHPEQAIAAVTQVAEPAEDPVAVTPPAADAATHYLVAATKRQGRWRAGRFWPPEQTRVARDELEADAWARVLADPALSVTPEV